MSSSTFPSTGGKPKFNPNASYEVAQGEPVPTGKKPAFNPKKSFELVHEKPEPSPSQSNQSGVQPFQPMTDWLNIPQAAQPLVQENAINDHNTKTAESSKRVQAHLADIDGSVQNLIYEKKKDLQGRIKSQELGLNPSEQGPVNPQVQQLEGQLRQDVQVHPEEIASFKEGMNESHIMLRQGLAQKAVDLDKTDPAQAKALKADIYRIDRKNDPQKDNKISANIEKINKGELDYDVVNGVLTKPVSFFGGIVEGFKEKGKAFQDYDVYSSGNEAEIIKSLNKKIAGDPDEPKIVGKEGFANVLPGGEGGMMLGGQPLKPMAAGALAGWMGGPHAGAAAMGLVSAPEMYKLGYAGALPQNYAAIKRQHPDISDADAYHQASELAEKQANVDAATGMAMGLLGGELAFKPTGLSSGLLQKSVGSALKQIGEEGAKKGLEGLGVGAIGATGQVIKNLMAQHAGLPVDETTGVVDQLKGGAEMMLGMTIAAKASGLLKPKTYNQLFQALSKESKPVVDANLDNLQKTGQITPEEAAQVQKGIDEHKALDVSIRGDVPESERLKIQEKIKQRDAKEKELETAHKAYHPEIKEEIKDLDDDILALSKGSDRGELQKLIDKSKIEGATKEYLKDLDEKELKDAFKEVASQAHDPNSANQTLEVFGEDIVNKAKELYPQEAPKESKISVIQPGETSRPEVITNNDNISVGELMNKEVSYKGQKGELYQDGQTVVFKVKGANREYEIGNIDEVKNSPISNYGIDHESSIVSMGEDGDISVRGNVYKNNYSDPLMAINRDKEGNVTSVNLETKDGKKRTFRGNVAEDIAYHLSLKEINKNNETRAAFEDFINSDESTKKQIENAGVSEATKEGAAENTSKIQRTKIEPEPITIKPKEDAIQVGSAEEIPLGETPGDSQPMGEGISQPGEAPGTQEPTGPKEEGSTPGQGQVGEPPMVGITHRQMDQISRELGLPEYSQDPENIPLWDRQAKERMAKDPEAMNKVINKLRNGDGVDKVETRMMIMHMAELKGKYDANPTPELLAQIARTKDLFNISGREKGKELAARKGALPAEENSLSDFHLRDIEFNKGAPLTEEQTAQSTKEFHEIKAAKDALEAKIAKMEAERIKEKAEKKVQQEVKAAKKDNKRDYKSERDKIFSDIKEKLRKARGETNVAGIPYAKELIAIAPDVIKLVANVIGEGVEKLPDIIKAVHGQVKELIPEITERDVHDIIAGEYNKKKQTRSQIQEKIFDLRHQAKLISKLESLESGVQPKSPKQKRVRNQEIESLRQQIKELEGSAGRTNEEKLTSLKGRYKSKIAELENKIKSGDFGPDEKPEPIELDKEGQELKDRYIEVKKERELRLAKQEYEDRPFKQRAWDTVLGVLDLRRMVGTAFDFSVPFRQALPVTINPLKAKTTAMAFKKMFSHFWSAKNLDRWWFDLENSADYKNMLDDGVPIHSPDDLRISKREEEFRTKLAEKIPVIGVGVKMSNRAASGYLNSMRVDLYRKGAKLLSDRGITRDNSPEVYKALGNDIANLTGSGKLLESLEGKPAGAIGSVFFGARLMAAKFNLLNPVTYAKMPKPIMRAALRDLAVRTGMYITAGYLAKAAGFSISLDPDDKDFLKLKRGETSYDITGGEAIYVRTAIRVLKAAYDRVTGEEKSSLKTAEKAGLSVTSFFRNKLAPTPAYGIDAFLGKKSTGEKFDPYDIVRIYPMWIDDIVDDWHQDKEKSILTAAIPSIFGIGVMTIPPKEEGSGSAGKSSKPTKQGKPSKTHK